VFELEKQPLVDGFGHFNFIAWTDPSGATLRSSWLTTTERDNQI
jgi:hypothetical protein